MKFNFHVSPNIKGNQSTQDIMRDLTIGLAVIFAIGVAYNGIDLGAEYAIHAIVLLLSSLITVFVCEGAFATLMKKDVKSFLKNSFGWVTGIILTLMVPISTPIYVMIVSTVFAIVVSKLLFGGFGQNIFNPAAVGRAVIFASFMGATTDLMTSATPTTAIATTYNWLPTSSSALASAINGYGGFTGLALGWYPGAVGDTFTIAIIIVGIILALRKVIDWRVPVVYCGTIVFITAIIAVIGGADSYHGVPAVIWYPVLHLVTGGAVFGAVFMLTDPVTSPTSAAGRVVFAMGAGILTVLIRTCSNLPEGCLYAILLMNMLTPMIENALDGKQLEIKAKAMKIVAVLVILAVALSFFASTKVGPKKESYMQAGIVEIVESEDTL